MNKKRGLPVFAGGETPPRAWGRPHSGSLVIRDSRNTPTSVGKTAASVKMQVTAEKHPHGRGEDLKKEAGNMEGERNTPTGVGKTRPERQPAGQGQKHPHGRGEDRSVPFCGYRRRETPPRAWGRQMLIRLVTGASRNTPTGVGKTLRIFHPLPQVKKHPHGRGEDFATITQR